MTHAALSNSPKENSQHRITVFTLMLLVVSVTLWFGLARAGFSATSNNLLIILLILGGFALAAKATFVLEIKKETHTFSFIEIPLICGLLTIGQPKTLASAILGTVLVYAIRGVPIKKSFFNLSLFSLAIGIVAWILQLYSVETIGSVGKAHSWIPIISAGAFESLLTSACVMIVIHLARSRMSGQQIVNSILFGLVSSLFNSIIAVVILLVLDVNPTAFALLIPLFAVLIVGYRSYSRFTRQHQTLEQAHEFSRFVDGMGRERGDEGQVLERVRELLNANRAVAWLAADGPVPAIGITAHADGTVNAVVSEFDESDPIYVHAKDSGKEVWLQSRNVNPEICRALRERKANEILVTPLRSSGRILGYLEIHDRLGDTRTFTKDDLPVFAGLAAHFTAALENQHLLERIRYQAFHDRLTDLPNREKLIESVDDAIAAAKTDSQLVAVALIDLDSFKDVNDALGHEHGDHLLVLVGERLRKELPAGSMIARMGADEFAVLFTSPDQTAAQITANEIHELFGKSFQLAELTVEVGASIGLSLAPEHAEDAGTLLQRADVALSAAKRSGRSVSTYVSTMEQATIHRLQLVTQLREALETGQVTVQYQPKIEISSNKLIGVEALVRWTHPVFGNVPPDNFVPLAERTGLIAPLTMHVLRTSLQQCRTWRDRGIDIGVAVNLSVRNLLDVDFPDKVAAAVADAEVPISSLSMEITETSVMTEPDRSLPVLDRLHQLGIRLSIDDFGMGQSSLAYLRRFPVSEVKIDKTFVLGMGSDQGDVAIVESIVTLGHSLNLRVVAEGVEDELSRSNLARMGCDIAQGFFISRALTPEKFDAWMQARTTPRHARGGIIWQHANLRDATPTADDPVSP